MSKHKKKQPKKFKHSLENLVRRFYEKNSNGDFSHKDVCIALDIRENALRKLAYDILQELSKDGYLKATGHGTFQLNNSGNFVVGYLDLTTRGAGFVSIEENDGDVYIAPQNVNQSLAGDLVKVQVIKQGAGRWEGKIIEVVERERTQFVGTLEMHEKFAFLIPDNARVGTDIYIPKEKLKGAKDKDRALVKITVWPKSADNPYGEVLEILSGSNPNDSEMISILCNHGIDYVFPNEVLSESEVVTMDLDEKEIAKRRDFRKITTFTIDPVDAKDFDDALSIQKLENGRWEIGVHIADVSHYVRPGMAMDVEALKRSNSVYLVDRVIPMLPEQLSNMACSLRPNEDKFTFSAVFEMDEEGKVYKEWFGKTVIHSDKRFAYEDAQEIIEGADGDFKSEILLFDKIAKILRGKRLKAGAMAIESQEVRFKLDDKGYPESLVIKVSKDANKLIEEFMLLANRKVAEFMGKPKKGEDKIPFVYRVHDNPDPAKIQLFNLFIKKFGYEIDYNHPDEISKKINALLDDIRYKNEYNLIQNMAIRSMAKATYEMDNIGHYGLAFEYYTHFTSPIRRYADLVVHRILQEELTTKKHRYGKDLNDICKRISRMERKATEAERESTKYFQVLFVQDKVGEEFEGTVSGIAEHGLYVKMDENQCEGMVAMQDIPGDRFSFDADKFQIVGGKTKKSYNIGDKVTVRIYEVHLRKRQIDLELIVD
jgi:ribonuclease R|tara:strand:+ start:2338 stop:4473 length:2136 start_codon:yes stop_codon:yes gene_type:complete